MKLYGFRIIGQCGREWFVPLSMVARDYADFRMQADGMTREAADAAAVEYGEHIDAWFHEQCSDWGFVDMYAFKVKKTGNLKTKSGMDNARGGYWTAKIQEVYIDELAAD